MGEDRALSKYLRQYAEPVIDVAPELSGLRYESALVVPAFAEDADGVRRLLAETHATVGRHVVVVVVNHPTSASHAQKDQNARLLRDLRQAGASSKAFGELTHIESPFGLSALDVLVVDATTGRFVLSDKEGVGKARKMGLDLVLSLHCAGAVASAFVGCGDADARLPRDYFGVLQGAGRGSAVRKRSGLLFPYRHLPAEDGELSAAMRLVESSFRYYVLGLAYARSPYAYHSLGSAMAVHLPHYARARGVPNRQAGEDFYLLEKLCKLAPLERLRRPTVSIETRLSRRVPFGTGPSLQKALGRGQEARIFHDPGAFVLLRRLLETLSVGTRAGPGVALGVDPSLPRWVVARAESVWKQLEPHLRSCPSAEHRLRRLHERFSALSTLQFIHEAHRQGLHRVSVAAVLAEAPFVPAVESIEELPAAWESAELELPSWVGPGVG